MTDTKNPCAQLSIDLQRKTCDTKDQAGQIGDDKTSLIGPVI